MNTDLLKQFGLSAKEASIYLSLLELGASSVSQIAVKAKINRTTAYDILEALVQYGLVSYVKEETKKHYVAENPEALVGYLEKKGRALISKASEAKKILPELKSVYNLIPHKPKVKYYDGEDGIIAMYEDSLTSRSEILSWLDPERTADFSEDYFSQYYKRRAEKGIHIKAIVNDVPISHEINSRNKAEDREMKIIPRQMMDIVPECYVYDDKVAFMSLREKFGVMIESKDIAKALRKLYELAWKHAGEIDKASQRNS